MLVIFAEVSMEAIKSLYSGQQAKYFTTNFKGKTTTDPVESNSKLERVPENDVVSFSETKVDSKPQITILNSQIENCRDSIDYINDEKGKGYTMVRDNDVNVHVNDSFWNGRSYTGNINDKDIDLKLKRNELWGTDKAQLKGKINGEDVSLNLQFGIHRMHFNDIPENIEDILPELSVLISDELEHRGDVEQNVTEAAAVYGAIK